MSNEELARRAVACKGWRWAPGMLSRCSTDTRRAVYRWLVGPDTRHYGLVCIVQDKHGQPCRNVATLQPGPDDLPDLTDQATLGCLLALVREAWGTPDLYVAPVEYVGPGPAPAWRAWAVEGPDLHVYTTSGKNEAAALVAALEVAP